MKFATLLSISIFYSLLGAAYAEHGGSEINNSNSRQNNQGQGSGGGFSGGMALGGGGGGGAAGGGSKRDTSNDNKALEEFKKTNAELQKNFSQSVDKGSEALNKAIEQSYKIQEDTEGLKKVEELNKELGKPSVAGQGAADALVKETEQLAKTRAEGLKLLQKNAEDAARVANTPDAPPRTDAIAKTERGFRGSGLGTNPSLGRRREPASQDHAAEPDPTYNNPLPSIK